MAVATLWTVTAGSDTQQHLFNSLPEQSYECHEDNQKSAWKKVHRRISYFLEGLITIIADLLVGKGIYLNGDRPYSSFAVNSS